MCGICGVADFSGAPIEARRVWRMVNTIHHRGPDDVGVAQCGKAVLGHARLSIIDLTPGGHQPMSVDGGRWWISYNGELYNYRELRQELKACGINFRSNSDTEVVLQAFVNWGAEALRRLEGMYAFAIWDKHREELHLVRDRFGIKPLYYAEAGGGFVFASEVKALHAGAGVGGDLALQGLAEYMWYGNTLGTETLEKGILKLPPGGHLIRSASGSQVHEYWTPADVTPSTDTLDQATCKVADLLEGAVRRHLQSDVPVGIFLSGGVDSSAITAFASRLATDRVKTFSAGFDFDPTGGELQAARRIAEHFGSEHHEFRISSRELESTFERLVWHHDQPFADAANIPLLMMAREVSSCTKVVLQGDGGDEVFGGYRRYALLSAEPMLSRAARVARFMGRYGFGRALPPPYWRMVDALSQRDPAMRMALLLTVETCNHSPLRILSGDLRREIGGVDPFRQYRKQASNLSHLDAVQQMLYADCRIILPETFLEKVDKSTMACSVEARVPMLDNRLTEYVLGLPANFKVRKGYKKYVLRRALRGIVPDWVLDGKKTGFGVPYKHWLREDLAKYASSVLLDPQTKNSNLFDVDALRRAIYEHRERRRDNGFLLWKALNLAVWHAMVSERSGSTKWAACGRA